MKSEVQETTVFKEGGGETKAIVTFHRGGMNRVDVPKTFITLSPQSATVMKKDTVLWKKVIFFVIVRENGKKVGS